MSLGGIYSTESLCETKLRPPRYWCGEQAHTKGVSENQLLFWMPGHNLWEMKNVRKIKLEDGGSSEGKFKETGWVM